MAAPLLRILSDLHYGDRASRLKRLDQLDPLCTGVDHLVLNGDTLDTRPGPYPDHTARLRAEVSGYFARAAPRVTFLTGNHDSDLSPHHCLDLADGELFVVHGDIFFPTLVPWSADVPLIVQRLREDPLSPENAAALSLEARLARIRRITAGIPPRQHAERDLLKYLARFFTDTVWPPTRPLRVLRAWRELPGLAAALVRRERPRARFVICGHTHRPGLWHPPGGPVVLNTGAYCPPFGRLCLDLDATHLRVREVSCRRGAFHPGDVVAAFPLAAV